MWERACKCPCATVTGNICLQDSWTRICTYNLFIQMKSVNNDFRNVVSAVILSDIYWYHSCSGEKQQAFQVCVEKCLVCWNWQREQEIPHLRIQRNTLMSVMYLGALVIRHRYWAYIVKLMMHLYFLFFFPLTGHNHH